MTIEAAEAQWLATTQPKTLRLGVFDDAEIEVRRHPSYPGAVCSLDFGCFTGLDGNRHDDRRCLWLSYITSEVPGQGRMLLRWLKAFAAEHGLYIAATPSAVTPEGWSPNRPCDLCPKPARAQCNLVRGRAGRVRHLNGKGHTRTN
jgi:hypothetical protein